MMTKYSGKDSVKDMKYERLVIKMKDPDNTEQVNALLNDIRALDWFSGEPQIINHSEKK